METRNYSQFNARYSMLYKQAQDDKNYPGRDQILENFKTSIPLTPEQKQIIMKPIEQKCSFGYNWTNEEHEKFLEVV